MADILQGGSEWLSEMDAFNQPGGHDGQPSTLEALQSEMKLLHWHKLANEAALKAALIRTKKMRAADAKNPPKESLKEKAEWMQQIIEEEQAKPLQVGKDYIVQYEAEEERNEAALQRQVEHHVNCLKNLRSSIERRETIKERKANFKEFKAQVEAERKAVLEGKVTAANRFKLAQSDQQGGEGSEQEAPAKGKQLKGTLSTVIGSLDKLVELEKRISSLESDNLHDRVKDGASVPQQKLARMKLAFTKKRTEPKPGVPAKPYYAVRVTRKGGAPGGARGIRGTMKGVNRKQEREQAGKGGGRNNKAKTIGAPAFMTQGKREIGAAYKSSTMGSGVARGSGRSAVAARSKASTQREQRNLNKIGKQNAQVRSKMYGGKVNSVSAGISTGIKTKNVHMQQFHNIRKQQQGRMENIRKGSVGGGTRGARGMGAGGKSSTMSGSRAMGGRKPVGGTRLNKTTGTRPAAGSRARPIPAANRGVRGGYKTTTGRSNNRGPPPKGASRFPAVKGASVGGRSVGGSGLSAVRAKAVRKKW
ncbi:hypothetical protein TeGR_g5579 [Tetraparma gracilis]|uniref:Uncharacterized protein n=1 Tax=Tetraparma gracilis TaxID=2962635 RepID=A0ABQ6N7R7_9STRA|nr:hypothetical protein TeGR_g5579 [Tetraparma gracilis]